MNTMESLQQVPWAAIAPLIVIQLILIVVTLISLVRAETVKGSKWIWASVIILGGIVGSIVYFVVGRKER